MSHPNSQYCWTNHYLRFYQSCHAKQAFNSLSALEEIEELCSDEQLQEEMMHRSQLYSTLPRFDGRAV
jgi:hypothetical protein